jgi:DNA uptake protein ComE-like DNA-binding protein
MIVVAVGAIALLLGAAIVVGAGGLPGSGPRRHGRRRELGRTAAGRVRRRRRGRRGRRGRCHDARRAASRRDRVGDALSAAGGSARVDRRAAAELNLAAILEDGSQIVVPSRTTLASVAGPGQEAVRRRTCRGSLTSTPRPARSSEALPGIGPVTATKIIESRTAAPFVAVEDLRRGSSSGEDVRVPPATSSRFADRR